jgi:nucleoside 2-deoxyribosyltransferase
MTQPLQHAPYPALYPDLNEDGSASTTAVIRIPSLVITQNAPTCYLAGPITGLTYAGAIDWREYARERLHAMGIVGLSPMRGKTYLSREETIGDAYAQHPLSTRTGILTRDRFDVMRCDLLLVNLLGAERVSIGTAMEVAWADAFRKPVVLVDTDGSTHDHAFIRAIAGYVVPTLEAGLNIVDAVLGVGA